MRACAGSDKSAQLDAVLSVPRLNNNLPWLLEVIPLNDLQGNIDGRFEGVAIFITNPDRKDVISTHGMEAIFNLTPAESDVCMNLANGSKIEDIALIGAHH